MTSSFGPTVLPLLIFLLVCSLSKAFQSYRLSSSNRIYEKNQEEIKQQTTTILLFATPDDDNKDASTTTTSGVEEYKNVATKVLSNFMQKDKMEIIGNNPIDEIDFDSNIKIPSTTSIQDLAQALDCELIEKEWFVTGKVRRRKKENLNRKAKYECIYSVK